MSEASKTPAEPARRFYKQAVAQALDGAFTVALDGRTLKTPAGAPFRVLPAAMAITQLAFAAIDWTGRDRTSRINYIASYGETDLCCHRAGSPEGLVARQAATWDPLVAWGRRELGVVLPVVTGIVAARAASETLAAISERAALLDDFHLTALSQATGLSGSMLIAFALLYGEVDAQRAFEAAALDDLWSLERWGEDAEARTRLMRMRAEFDALAAFIACLSA